MKNNLHHLYFTVYFLLSIPLINFSLNGFIALGNQNCRTKSVLDDISVRNRLIREREAHISISGLEPMD